MYDINRIASPHHGNNISYNADHVVAIIIVNSSCLKNIKSLEKKLAIYFSSFWQKCFILIQRFPPHHAKTSHKMQSTLLHWKNLSRKRKRNYKWLQKGIFPASVKSLRFQRSAIPLSNAITFQPRGVLMHVGEADLRPI